MNIHAKTLIVGALLGGLIGGGTMYAVNARKEPVKAPSSAQSTTDTPTTTKQAPVVSGDFDSGDGLTPVQMHTELQRITSESEFDRKYMTYTILMKNLENGMAGLVEDKTSRNELVQSAAKIREQNDPTVTDMLNWQRLWGFTDH